MAITSKTIKGIVILTRPFMSILAGVATLISIYISSPDSFSRHPYAILGIGNLFLFAGSMIVNDWFDVEIDSLNKPNRPIPSGLVTKKQAMWATVMCFVLGIVASAFVSIQIGVWSLIFTILSVCYSAFIKKILFFGNVLVAALTSYPFFIGGVLFTSLSRVILPVCATLFYILGREILKTIEDTRGDSAFGVKTISVKLGTTTSVWAGVSVMFLALFLALGQYFLQINNIFFLISMLLIILFQLIISISLARDHISNLPGYLNYSALVMLAVTISFSIGVVSA
jgi:geranylgeranylglycerol-phosphate geranylgeranyltransferase